MTNKSVTVKEIFTPELSFTREPIIDFENYDKAVNKLNIDVVHNDDYIKKGELTVSVEVNITQTLEDVSIVQCRVLSVGIFEVGTDIDSTFAESFASINAPAIIFPFVRENIATASARAGLPAIYIQPVNFVEHSKRVKNQLDQ